MLVFGGVGLLFTALALAFLILNGDSWGRAPQLELQSQGRAPSWELTDQTGAAVRSRELAGKIVVADFIYTSCTDTCPALSLKMQLIERKLRAEGLLGERVQLLSFTTDPERDSPEVLRRYSQQFQADPAVWSFLTGPKDVLIPTIVNGFKLGVDFAPAAGATPHLHADGAQHEHAYTVLHSNRFALIDGDGVIVKYYDGMTVVPEEVVGDVREMAGR